MRDLQNPSRLAEQIENNMRYHNFVLTEFHNSAPVSLEECLEATASYWEALGPMVVDVSSELARCQEARCWRVV